MDGGGGDGRRRRWGKRRIRQGGGWRSWSALGSGVGELRGGVGRRRWQPRAQDGDAAESRAGSGVRDFSDWGFLGREMDSEKKIGRQGIKKNRRSGGMGTHVRANIFI